ncbi:hypothetical protein H072_4666 [Dactylellina haptotyla CBS 200.50]|uniref:Uncharacterized protein n=1 Tax=Dactylellina haptotyla (strain CBS 200.50) TaxID=1284197 RepID=S8C1I1_DACHA|nr:hypothetical protein H072_4666 [Dactylellina haptotyla CBS 200.50]
MTVLRRAEKEAPPLQPLMRPAFPLVPIALLALLLAVFLTNVWPLMFNKISGLHNKVQSLTDQVQNRLQERRNIQDSQKQGQGYHEPSRPPPIPHESKPEPKQPEQSVPPVPSHPGPSNEALNVIRRRWRNQLLGDFEALKHPEPAVKAKIDELSTNAGKLLELYVDGEKTDRVFKNAGPLCATNMQIKSTYFRLLTIAAAWATPGTKYYQDQEVVNKIIAGIDFACAHTYYSSNPQLQQCLKSRQNWWALQIGAPLNLADLCVLIFDHLDLDRRKRWGQNIIDIVGNTTGASWKGGNRAWISRVLIITGLFMDDGEVIRKGIAALSVYGGTPEAKKSSVFGYVKPGEGEGLYEDGSLLSHDVYPYAGGYGLVMLTSVALLLNLLNSPETPDDTYRINDPRVSLIYDAVERNFMPVVWHGIIFEHVRGREVARRDGPGWCNGHQLIHAASLLSQGSNDPRIISRMESYVCLWHDSNPADTLEKATIAQIPILRSIVNKRNSILARHPHGAFSTPIQEHFVYHSPDGTAQWCFTLSLSSTRIGRAETLNNENLKSWYQGDGMTYLYTVNHKTHYGDDYWPTMDPLHVPGTTNHQIEPPEFKYKSMGYNPWSGGACWSGGGQGWRDGVAYKSDGYGARAAAVSLDHLAVDRKSAAKKSWFMLENVIIAMGAGCAGSSDPASNLHTTVESRNLDQPGRVIVVNDIEYSDPPGWKKETPRVHWAWLEGTAGYIFLDSTDPDLRASGEAPQVNKIFERVKKCGAWKDITGDGKPDEICREYVNIVLDHGVNPQNSAYAYVILPLASIETTKYLAGNPTWRVFRNTVDAQAVEVRFDGGEVMMATFWKAGEVNGITVEQGCQLLWGRNGNKWCLTVSDPSWQTQRVVVHLDVVRLRGLQPREKSQGVEVHQDTVVFDGLSSGAAKSVFFEGFGHDEL